MGLPEPNHDHLGGILALLDLTDRASEVASVSYRDESEPVGPDYGPTRQFRRLGTHFEITFLGGGTTERFIPAEELDRRLAEIGSDQLGTERPQDAPTSEEPTG